MKTGSDVITSYLDARPRYVQALTTRLVGPQAAMYGWDLRDVVQDVWVELLATRAKFDPAKGSAATYVRLVIYRVLARLRRRSMRRATEIAFSTAL